jgi:hypothetical protein
MTTKTKEPIDALVIRHLRGTLAPMRVVCAWCRAVMVDGPHDGNTSHGICRTCAAAEAAKR